MTLLVDIGNSRIKWAFLRGGELGPVEAAARRGQEDDALWATLWAGTGTPSAVYVASVSGTSTEESLKQWCSQRWALSPRFIRSNEVCCGLHNGYDRPELLGVDRWLAMIGARQLVSGPLCVADFGTAITVDAVSADGTHLGGWIAPGLTLMAGAVQAGTRGVRAEFATTGMAHGYGHNTAAALNNGVCNAASGMLRQAISLLNQQTDGEVGCVVTGGDAPVLLPLLPQDCLHSPVLVLLGMAEVVRERVEGSLP